MNVMERHLHLTTLAESLSSCYLFLLQQNLPCFYQFSVHALSQALTSSIAPSPVKLNTSFILFQLLLVPYTLEISWFPEPWLVRTKDPGILEVQ